MGAMLLQQGIKSRAAGLTQQPVSESDSAVLSRRRRVVVEAEQSTPAVFRLVVGLVLLMSIGVAGWLAWLAWNEYPVAGTVAADSAESAVPSTTVNVPVTDPLRQEDTNNPVEQREAERLERQRLEAEQRRAEQLEVERLERERLEAEQRLAEQREEERLERERLEAEKRRAEQREVERLERERLEAEQRLAELREAERLERERQEAEQRLAEQREAELEAKRAAALAAWKKANSGIGWAEEVEDDEGESD
jgi:flagellar biosynthesis GTPase FlhF